jgi:hypothetical protein
MSVQGLVRYWALAAASFLMFASPPSGAGDLQIDVLRPIYKNGMVVSCSMTLSAVLQSLAREVEGDQKATFKLIMLSREPSCSSSEYVFPVVAGGELSITFKRIVAPERGGFTSDLLVVMPNDPRLRKACAEINKMEGALCLSETTRK